MITVGAMGTPAVLQSEVKGTNALAKYAVLRSTHVAGSTHETAVGLGTSISDHFLWSQFARAGFCIGTSLLKIAMFQ